MQAKEIKIGDFILTPIGIHQEVAEIKGNSIGVFNYGFGIKPISVAFYLKETLINFQENENQKNYKEILKAMISAVNDSQIIATN
jgi:hypothetical protein